MTNRELYDDSSSSSAQKFFSFHQPPLRLPAKPRTLPRAPHHQRLPSRPVLASSCRLLLSPQIVHSPNSLSSPIAVSATTTGIAPVSNPTVAPFLKPSLKSSLPHTKKDSITLVSPFNLFRAKISFTVNSNHRVADFFHFILWKIVQLLALLCKAAFHYSPFMALRTQALCRVTPPAVSFTPIVDRLPNAVLPMETPLKPCKRVRFRSDVAQKLRPTASNLRPLGRLVKKEGNSVDQVTTLLNRWDDIWRSYLKSYYDDRLRVQKPSSPTQFHEMIDTQHALAIMAERCREAFASWAMAQRHDTVLPLDEAIRKTRDRRFHLLSSMIDYVTQWRDVEQGQWSAPSEVFAERHQRFCDFVERIDTTQRKYKSLGDFERRLYRRAQKARTKNSSLPNCLISEPSCLDELNINPTQLRPMPMCATTLSY
eukprot:Gregarina_sp_Poly_1__1692@NODE_1434_length_4160_cov_162_480332_g182_i2_p1_GENE_NODE_1434_length_4160_cov_162_480332_g182_i2NODE_1434_length_4160_cov_162_480332_g182_i2_p1_ORF_typecomplete_len426_score43_78_NODE_1434_length_4160_cov_162_480332_g182_i219603237